MCNIYLVKELNYVMIKQQANNKKSSGSESLPPKVKTKRYSNKTESGRTDGTDALPASAGLGIDFIGLGDVAAGC